MSTKLIFELSQSTKKKARGLAEHLRFGQNFEKKQAKKRFQDYLENFEKKKLYFCSALHPPQIGYILPPKAPWEHV